MKIHNARIRAFSTPEDLEKTRQLLKNILPEETPLEEKTIEPELEGGVFTKPLHDLNARLSGNKAAGFLKKTILSLDEYDYNNLKEKKEQWLDDECNLYLRLNKKEAADGRIVFDAKDPIHATIKIAAYPSKKENAIKILEQIITETEDERKIR